MPTLKYFTPDEANLLLYCVNTLRRIATRTPHPRTNIAWGLVLDDLCDQFAVQQDRGTDTFIICPSGNLAPAPFEERLRQTFGDGGRMLLDAVLAAVPPEELLRRVVAKRMGLPTDSSAADDGGV